MTNNLVAKLMYVPVNAMTEAKIKPTKGSTCSATTVWYLSLFKGGTVACLFKKKKTSRRAKRARRCLEQVLQDQTETQRTMIAMQRQQI